MHDSPRNLAAHGQYCTNECAGTMCDRPEGHTGNHSRTLIEAHWTWGDGDERPRITHFDPYPTNIGDTCCGNCPGGTCYVDQVAGA